MAMLDEHGQLRWEGQVDPDGLLEVSRNEIPCPFRHPGQYHDEETGLSYNRFRYYDPNSAQYTSPDPVRCIGGLLMAPYIRRGEFGQHSLQDLTSTTSLYGYVEDPMVWIDPFGLVRIHTDGGVEVNAYPGPPAGGIDHKPLHVHVNEAGERETRVLMEDWVDNGRVKGRMGEVYPGDPALSKRAKKVIKRHLDDLARKTDEVFHTGSCK
jgi:RHS repeat-associated protein